MTSSSIMNSTVSGGKVTGLKGGSGSSSSWYDNYYNEDYAGDSDSVFTSDDDMSLEIQSKVVVVPGHGKRTFLFIFPAIYVGKQLFFCILEQKLFCFS